MQKLLGGYGRWFNLRHGLEGHLFRSPFWSRCVKTDAHVVVGVSYVALNPVRAGLCSHSSDWRWTTHRELAGLEPASLVRADGLLSSLGNGDVERGRAEYAEIVERDLARLCAAAEREPLPGYIDERPPWDWKSG
jgi:putative transposase